MTAMEQACVPGLEAGEEALFALESHLLAQQATLGDAEHQQILTVRGQAVVAPLQSATPDWEACFLALSSVLDALEDDGDILEPPFAQLASTDERLSQLLDQHSVSLKDQVVAAYAEHAASGSRQLTDLLLQQHQPSAAQKAQQSLYTFAKSRAEELCSPAAASEGNHALPSVSEGAASVGGLGWNETTPDWSIPDTPTLLRQAGHVAAGVAATLIIPDSEEDCKAGGPEAQDDAVGQAESHDSEQISREQVDITDAAAASEIQPTVQIAEVPLEPAVSAPALEGSKHIVCPALSARGSMLSAHGKPQVRARLPASSRSHTSSSHQREAPAAAPGPEMAGKSMHTSSIQHSRHAQPAHQPDLGSPQPFSTAATDQVLLPTYMPLPQAAAHQAAAKAASAQTLQQPAVQQLQPCSLAPSRAKQQQHLSGQAHSVQATVREKVMSAAAPILGCGSGAARHLADSGIGAAAMLQAADLPQAVSAASLRSQLAQASIVRQDLQTDAARRPTWSSPAAVHRQHAQALPAWVAASALAPDNASPPVSAPEGSAAAAQLLSALWLPAAQRKQHLAAHAPCLLPAARSPARRSQLQQPPAGRSAQGASAAAARACDAAQGSSGLPAVSTPAEPSIQQPGVANLPGVAPAGQHGAQTVLRAQDSLLQACSDAENGSLAVPAEAPFVAAGVMQQHGSARAKRACQGADERLDTRAKRHMPCHTGWEQGAHRAGNDAADAMTSTPCVQAATAPANAAQGRAALSELPLAWQQWFAAPRVPVNKPASLGQEPGCARAPGSAEEAAPPVSKLKDVVRAALHSQVERVHIPQIVPQSYRDRNRQAARVIRQTAAAIHKHAPDLQPAGRAEISNEGSDGGSDMPGAGNVGTAGQIAALQPLFTQNPCIVGRQ